MSSIAGWGKYYIRLGWKLIPIHVIINGACSCGKYPCGEVAEGSDTNAGKNAGKHPTITGWTNPNNTIYTDLQVERTWGEGVPLQYSMGLLCGQPSGVWVLDIDPRNGGFESIEQFELENPLPKTLTAVTGGGGRHLFFRLPPNLILTKGPLHKDLPGIDVQAEGSQIVLPPSMHRSGTRYEWVDINTPIVEAPQSLISLIQGDRGKKGSGPGGTGVDLDDIAKNGIPKGERNTVLHKVACKFARKFGVKTQEDMNMVFSAVATYNEQFAKPPLSRGDLATLTNSAIEFIRANPDNGNIDPALVEWLEQNKQTPKPVVVAVPDNPKVHTYTPDVDEVEESTGPDNSPPPPPDESIPVAAPKVVDSPSNLPPDNDHVDMQDPGSFGQRTLTDNGNARRIVDYFGENLRYTIGGGWHYWDGTTWRADGEGSTVFENARNLSQLINAEAIRAEDSTPTLKWAEKSRDASRIRNAVSLSTTDPRVKIHHHEWDANPDWLGVRNGVVDLRTGKLLAPDRSQYITKRTAVDFNPKIKDTRFDIFLDQITAGDKEFQQWLQKVVGYTLTGETSEQKFFLFYGAPGSGKSTLLEIVKALLGEYSLALNAEVIMANKYGQNSSDQYYTAEMEGRRMLAVSELPEAEMMKEDAVKRLSGGDSMTGRRIGQQPFNFTSQAKLWIATNHRPRVGDPGIWRRMQAIPFENVPKIVDTTLKPYLQSPQGGLPAALAWASIGARMWYEAREGIGTCRVVEEATAQYKENEDEIGIFLKEEFVVGEGYSTTISEFHAIWQNWAMEQGLNSGGPLNKLRRRLVDRGITVDGIGRTANVIGYARRNAHLSSVENTTIVPAWSNMNSRTS